MANESKLGKDQQDEELGAIVASYFAANFARATILKSMPGAAALARTGRPLRSSNSSTRTFRRSWDELDLGWMPPCGWPREVHTPCAWDGLCRRLECDLAPSVN